MPPLVEPPTRSGQGPLPLLCGDGLAVHVASMSDVNDVDAQQGIVDAVDDPVSTTPVGARLPDDLTLGRRTPGVMERKPPHLDR